MESLGVPKVLMLPDEYLAQNVARQTHVELIAWKGHCEVHQLFTPQDIRDLRDAHPGVIVLPIRNARRRWCWKRILPDRPP